MICSITIPAQGLHKVHAGNMQFTDYTDYTLYAYIELLKQTREVKYGRDNNLTDTVLERKVRLIDIFKHMHAEYGRIQLEMNTAEAIASSLSQGQSLHKAVQSKVIWWIKGKFLLLCPDYSAVLSWWYNRVWLRKHHKHTWLLCKASSFFASISISSVLRRSDSSKRL